MYQLTELGQHLLHDPIQGSVEDKENILQSYGIFDSLLPQKTIRTFRNEQWSNYDAMHCFFHCLLFMMRKVSVKRRVILSCQFIFKLYEKQNVSVMKECISGQIMSLMFIYSVKTKYLSLAMLVIFTELLLLFL